MIIWFKQKLIDSNKILFFDNRQLVGYLNRKKFVFSESNND